MKHRNPSMMSAAARVVGLVTGLSACSVGDDYQRPELAIPAAWVAGAAGEQTGAAAWPSADWWRRFGSPALDQLMAEAERANADLAVALAQVRQADAQVRIAGAALLPAVDGGASANHQLQPALQPNAAKGKTDATAVTTKSLTLNASYELDFWGKNAATRDAARAAAAASRFDRQVVALTVQSGVATTYFTCLGLSDRLAVARANVTNAETVLAAIKDRLRFGTATELDLAQQESVVAGLRAQVPPLDRQWRQNLNALALLIGALPERGQGLAVGTLSAIKAPPVAPGLPSALLARRPDVALAEAQLIGANADITAARAALFPSIKLTGELGVESLALGTLLQGSSLLYSLAAGITQPIFHGEALAGGLELKQARYEELVQAYRKAVLSAFSDVENALIAATKSAEEEAAELTARNTAQRANAISLAQFNAGLVDITTLLNTQKALFQAEDALVQARLDHLQTVVALYKALGGGWQAPGPVLDKASVSPGKAG